MKVCGILIFFFFSLVTTAPASPLSLEDCLKIALARYPRLKALSAKRKAREALSEAARKDLYPRLSWKYQYTRLRDRQKIVILGHDVPISSYEMIENNLLLEVPLFHGLALRIKRRLRALEADISRVEEERGRQEVAYLVKEAYFSLLEKKYHLKEAQKSVARLKKHLKIVRAYYAEGLVAKHQVLSSEVALAEAQHIFILAQNQLHIAESRLNILLDRPLRAPISVEDSFQKLPPKLKSLSYYLDLAQKLRPELRIARLACQKARENIRLAKATYYPQIDLLGNYQRRGTDLWATQNPYWDRENISFTFNLRLLLWDWGKRRQEVAAARAEALAREEALRELEKEIALQVEEAYFLFKAARKQLEVARKALSQAEENFRLQQSRFKEGLAESADVLDAEAFLAAAEARLIEALANLHLSRARLLFAVGEDPYQ